LNNIPLEKQLNIDDNVLFSAMPPTRTAMIIGWNKRNESQFIKTAANRK